MNATTLSHFESTQDVCKFALEMILGELQDDLSVMIGSEAEQYTEDEVGEIEDKIADLTATLDALNSNTLSA